MDEQAATRGKASAEAQFQYAMMAVSSARTHDVRSGVAVLQGLIEQEGPRREYLYFIAQGQYNRLPLYQGNEDISFGHVDAMYRWLSSFMTACVLFQVTMRLGSIPLPSFTFNS